MLWYLNFKLIGTSSANKSNKTRGVSTAWSVIRSKILSQTRETADYRVMESGRGLKMARAC